MEILKTIMYIYVVVSVTFTTFFLFGLVRELRKKLKKEDAVDDIKKAIKLVYIEKVGDVSYLYDGLSHTFITQAHTEDEMWANAKSIFPDKDFIISGEKGEAILVSVKDKK